MNSPFLCLFSLATFTAVSAVCSEPEEAVRIGPRMLPAAAENTAAAYARTAQLCKSLAPEANPAAATRAATLAALRRDDKATELLPACLDARYTAEARVRAGALAALAALKPVGPNYSAALALAAVADPTEAVRKAAVATIKDRHDDAATDGMVKNLISAYGDGGKVLNDVVRRNALASIKELDDKRVYSALLYYVTMELRAEMSQLNSFTTRQIDSYNVNQGLNAGIITPLSFPIQFPELSIVSVKTTVVAPAAALNDLTGQNFGNDVDKWTRWLRKQ